MEKTVDDLSLGLAVLELVQEEDNVPDDLRKMAAIARTRLAAVGNQYLKQMAVVPAG